MGSLVLDSRIDQVTIYRAGALVERIAELKPTDDGFPEFVQLNDLPVCMENGSVRVQVTSHDPQQQAPIASDLKVSVVAQECDDEPESVEAWRKEIEQLQYKVEDLKRDVNQVKRSIQHLRNVEMDERPTPDQAQQAMPNPTDARLTLGAFLSAEEKALIERSQKLVSERKDAKRRMSHLQEKINEHDAPAEVKETEIKKTVSVRVHGKHTNGSPATLRLQYMVPGAQWFPTYSLRVNDNPPVGELAMQAMVAQATNEDWMGVNLRLSTADPQQWTELKKLHSLRIGRKQPDAGKKGWREPPQGVEALFADYDAFKRTMTSDMVGEFEPDLPMGGGMMAAGAAYDEEGLDDELSLSDMVCEAEEMEMPMPCSARPEPKELLKSVSLSRSMAPPAPMKQKKMSQAQRRSRGRAMPGGREESVPELELEPTIDDSFLQYASLRLPAMTAAGRGKLVVDTESVESTPSWLASTVSEAVYLAMDLPPTPASCVEVGSYDSFDYAYCCATPVDVPSKHKYQTIPVTRQSVAIDMRYVTVPREGKDVYRMAKITNPLQTPLLAGPVDVYLNDEFLLSSKFEVIAPRGHADVGLGVDQAVKVARNTDFKETTDSGIFGSTLVLCHSIDIDVINNLKHAIDLEVRERAPIKDEEEKDIEIVIHDVEPTWLDYKPASHMRGRYVWKITVDAGGKQQLKAAYDVKISAKNELVGGNRREV